MIFNLEPLRKNLCGKIFADSSFYESYSAIFNALMFAQAHAAERNIFYAENKFDLATLYAEHEAKMLLQVMTHCATRLNVLPLPKGRLNELQDDLIVTHNAQQLLFPKEKRNV